LIDANLQLGIWLHDLLGVIFLMALLDLLFRKEKPDHGPTDVRFGRYSDAYKESAQYHHWDASLSLFEKGMYLESYERTFWNITTN